jgi:hypothetical protein
MRNNLRMRGLLRFSLYSCAFPRKQIAQRMKILNASKLPAAASRSEWARLLHVDPSTLRRADIEGALQVSRVGGRLRIYTKAAILKWLKLGGVTD